MGRTHRSPPREAREIALPDPLRVVRGRRLPRWEQRFLERVQRALWRLAAIEATAPAGEEGQELRQAVRNRRRGLLLWAWRKCPRARELGELRELRV